jgi:hypothetical protein
MLPTLFAGRGEHGELRMKHAMLDGHRLEFVILAHALRPLLAEARTHAANIRQNERLGAAAPNQPVEDNGFEERKRLTAYVVKATRCQGWASIRFRGATLMSSPPLMPFVAS